MGVKLTQKCPPLSDKDKLTHKQFISDMKATKSIDLWPETDGLPSSKCNFTSMWRAINIHLLPLEHKSGKVISSSSENSEKTKQTTKNSNTTKISKSGRKRGVQNFTKKELECLLDLIEEHKPCGALQWDLVSSGLYDAGYKSRDRDSCKKKFDRLWQTSKPTGSTEMPLHIRRAKDIKDVISSHEVIGYASLNSDDSCDGLAGTNLVTKDGEMKHPVTQKRKKAKMINMLDDTCESITASNKEVTNSLEKIAKAIEKFVSFNNS